MENISRMAILTLVMCVGVWDSMMHVHFDQGGIVRMLQNGPDRMKEPHDFPC